MRCTSISCTGCMWKPEIKPTANLRESSRIAFYLRSGALLRLMRASQRLAGFAPIRGWFFSCVYTNAVHEIEVHLIRTSVFHLRSHRVSPIKKISNRYF